ncbi:MAG: bifunctional methylenetetrahydrofolate dehydrogenase/methenyltetrahydrofolate cyclohydrolase FolD [Acidimicrobiia bacterium]|nr:bifunctional methylenetetrahydrofolate dehydrogenase/methenyltetrahydrofolate cyclohydrolase FolD [Acidimicrobiia bacterium]NNL70124.1 bifunctional methylenetetrahydrofolate dehydrogenase/methenyltetrahydrofolate cyclohydrolase FolD [Acidimicrobiia bacterium]
MTQLLTGKEPAQAIKDEVAERINALNKRVGLATVLVGDDPASEVYVRMKHKAAATVGMYTYDHHIPGDTPQDEVEDLVRGLNADPAVDGILVQLPLPDGLDPDAVIDLIEPGKDADGLHPHSLGLVVLERSGGAVPATPQGIMRMLDYYDIETEGKLAVIIGRSRLVGRPMGLLLNHKSANATVVFAHSRTRDLPAITRQADILIVAAGRPGLVTADGVKPGAVVVDVGINRVDEKLVGDVDFESISEVASAITPVPGGVGPMTIASLLLNTVVLAESRIAAGT